MNGRLFLARAGDQRLAIPLAAVREVLPVLPIERPPGLPRPLVGFVAVRGTALPLVAPQLLLDPEAAVGPIDLFAHILCPHRGPALLLDRVEDLRAPDTIRPIAPDRSLNGAIAGEAVFGDTVAHLLTLDRLLQAAEQDALDRLTHAARDRLSEWAAA